MAVPPRSSTALAVLAWTHGVFYILSGGWALVGIESFQMITGPKTDLWLVRTVGSLLTLTGILLLVGACRRRVSVELAVIALGQNLILSAIALVYVWKGVILSIYLFDAMVQTTMALAWLFALWRQHVSLSPREDSSRAA